MGPVITLARLLLWLQRNLHAHACAPAKDPLTYSPKLPIYGALIRRKFRQELRYRSGEL